MKKRTLIAVLIIGILFVATTLWAAELNNVTSKGVDGNLVYYDSSGNEINTWDATNRRISIPSGSSIAIQDGGSVKGLAMSITSKVLAIADWVMSAVEKLTTLLICTSGSTGTNYIIDSPGTAGRVFIIRNASNGSIVIKENGQTGVTIAKDKTAVVMHNGTDYVRVTADATH